MVPGCRKLFQIAYEGDCEPQGPGTSKLDWRYLEHSKIDRNELYIRTNSRKGTGTKIAEKLNNFEKFEGKKSDFSPVLNPETS